MKLSKKCCEQKNEKLVTCKENKKVFLVKNPQKKTIHKCRVDGCWIEGGILRCDYLVQVEDTLLYLVELKGTDHSHALEQIISTAEHLNVSSFRGKKLSAIVGAPCPKASSKYQRAQKKLAARFKAAGISFPQKKNGSLSVSV